MVVIRRYEPYNGKRFSRPWVCEMSDRGEYLFDNKVGTYDGTDMGGELVVFEPVEGKVYGFGMKDYRGSRTSIGFVKYSDGKFVPCSRLGKEA